MQPVYIRSTTYSCVLSVIDASGSTWLTGPTGLTCLPSPQLYSSFHSVLSTWTFSGFLQLLHTSFMVWGSLNMLLSYGKFDIIIANQFSIGVHCMQILWKVCRNPGSSCNSRSHPVSDCLHGVYGDLWWWHVLCFAWYTLSTHPH